MTPGATRSIGEVREALIQAGRQDLIGGGCDCLIPAQPPKEAIEARRTQANAAARVVIAVTLDFLDAYLRNEPGALARLTRDAGVARVSAIRAATS